MADTVTEAQDLLEKVLQICIDRNVYLKLSKSNLIVTECDFFGYTIRNNAIQMQDSVSLVIIIPAVVDFYIVLYFLCYTILANTNLTI